MHGCPAMPQYGFDGYAICAAEPVYGAVVQARERP